MSAETGGKKLVSFRFFHLTLGSLFKIGFICNLFFWMPIGIWVGIGALFGGDNLTWNEEAVTGFSGLVGGIVMAFASSVIGAIILMLGGIVARFVNRWVSFGGVQYVDT